MWLEAATKQVDDSFWEERDIQERLASLLDSCWRSHQTKLRRNQKAFDAFKSLLKDLANRQNKVAMELQLRMLK